MTQKEKLKLLGLRDALISKDIDEAYHILYTLADPKFEKINPWREWEYLKTQDKLLNKDKKQEKQKPGYYIINGEKFHITKDMTAKEIQEMVQKRFNSIPQIMPCVKITKSS